MKFRKRPVVIEARLFDGSSESAMSIIGWGQDMIDRGRSELSLSIETLEGIMKAQPGDWIIKGVNGEFYPCKPDIFEKTYEAVDETKT